VSKYTVQQRIPNFIGGVTPDEPFEFDEFSEFLNHQQIQTFYQRLGLDPDKVIWKIERNAWGGSRDLLVVFVDNEPFMNWGWVERGHLTIPS
jgi:hypothetical protein